MVRGPPGRRPLPRDKDCLRELIEASIVLFPYVMANLLTGPYD